MRNCENSAGTHMTRQRGYFEKKHQDYGTV